MIMTQAKSSPVNFLYKDFFFGNMSQLQMQIGSNKAQIKAQD